MQVAGTLRELAVREVVSDKRIHLTGQDLATVLAIGVLPFLVGDLIKVALALLLTERL